MGFIHIPELDWGLEGNIALGAFVDTVQSVLSLCKSGKKDVENCLSMDALCEHVAEGTGG